MVATYHPDSNQLDGLFETTETGVQGNSFAGLPLAARMRPRTLDEFAGQQSVVGEGALLRRAIEEAATIHQDL